ncbi:MAG TPA: hypothetical protein DEQ30_07275, partial [Porphyromonadaceae bacterium]|nr:hypothetical protein [Porphyromonadaceae bacterium]
MFFGNECLILKNEAMKSYVFMTGFILSIFMMGCSASKGLTKEEKAVKETVLRKAIENREFMVDVERMLPMSGRSRALTSSYSLEIDGDRVKSHLPYVGRAYSVPYGGGDGLNFESTVTDYKSSFDDKGKAVIEFQAKTPEDRYSFRLEIFPNGSASVNVTSVNR